MNANIRSKLFGPLPGISFGLVLLFMTASSVWALEAYKKFYLQGLEYKQKGQCDQALAAFEKALAQKDKEKKKIRFYGMRYGEYMPHREKGICHYQLKQYKQAVAELEVSLAMVSSEAARKYLNLAKIEMAKLKPEDVIEVVQTPVELKQMKKARSVNRYAVGVVIGNRDYYDKDIPPVSYAIQDASMVREYLIKTFGYREGNVIFKTNATKGIFENIFGSGQTHKGMLYDYLTPGKSDVFVYYSGHGAPSLESRKGYILPVDGNPNNVAIGGYALELLYANLAKLQARSITVVTDACFSGAQLFKNASPVGIIVKNPLVAVNHTSILNSSSGTELSSWYPQKGHGLFTYYFLLGIAGKADANSDKKITVLELSDFIKDNVPYMARKLHDGRKQTPTFKTSDKVRVLVNYK